MHKLTFTSMVLLASAAAFADIDHSQLINLPGGGTGGILGADLSQLTAGETIFGYGIQGGSNNTMADDFTVGAGGFQVTGVRVFAYLTGGTTPVFTQLKWGIGAAPIISSGLTTSVPTASGWWNSGSSVGAFRTNLGDTTSNNRRIQFAEVTGLNITLGAGTHFLSWNGGTSGVTFTPPIPNTQAVWGKNAQQSIANGAFAPVVNGTVGGADLAFVIIGQAIPEPTTMAILGLGAAALLRRRAKK